MIAVALAAAMTFAGAPKAAPKQTQLTIAVKPSNAVFYVDGKKKGTGAKAAKVPLAPGRHVIRVVHGKDEHEEQIAIKKGEQKSWEWAFEDDRPAPPAPPLDTGGEDSNEKKPGGAKESVANDAASADASLDAFATGKKTVAADSSKPKAAGKSKKKAKKGGPPDPLDL